MQEQPDIEVTLTVTIRHPNNFGGEEPDAERTFKSRVDSDGDRFRVARANVHGLSDSALAWLHAEGDKRR